MSSIKDYKPGDMIVDEATGILYDPRYGSPKKSVCDDCTVSQYCWGNDKDIADCMKRTYNKNPDGYYDPSKTHRIDYDNLIKESENKIENRRKTISKLYNEIRLIEKLIKKEENIISEYQKKIDNNDEEYVSWKNFLETGTWKKLTNI